MDRSPPQPYLPMRFIHYGQFSYYYAYGNTPADDFLEHVHFEDEREPIVLSLGCGDIRSPFYTLWKHFDPSLSRKHFSGVRFVLNDISAAVLARNILFLYLTVNMPSWNAGEAAKQWISNLWAIWYCHELCPDHDRTLKEALDALVHYSGTVECWESSPENPLRRLVSFTNADTLKQIRKTWEMWRTKFFGSVGTVKTELLKKRPSDKGVSPALIVDTCRWLKVAHGQSLPKKVYNGMSEDYTHYWENGSVYAEECLNLSCSTTHTVVNPTLFEREDGLYSLHYASTPYECFIQGFLTSKSQIQNLGMDLGIAGQPLIVEDDSFERHPLLSNCVQQFSLWVSSAAATLRAQSSKVKPNVTFILNCSNCVHFCEEIHSNPQLFLAHTGIQPTFDVIYASNLIDRLSPPVLIHACKPLLKKKTGFLLTTTFLYRSAAPSADQYLRDPFGFSPELLPVISGVRCIGHDGRYTDTTSIVPAPFSLDAIYLDLEYSRYKKVLIWQRVDPLPVKVGALVEQAHCSQALHGAIHTAVVAFYDKTPSEQGLITRTALCTETAINTILSFASQLDATVDISDHRFWDSLCSLVRDDTPLRPFLVHIQTQALLHGLHFHLTLSENECPLCLKKSIEEVVSQFSIEFHQLSMEIISPFSSNDTPAFPLVIHKAPLTQAYDNLGPDDHIVDSAQVQELPAGKLRLDFFFPTHFIEEGYHATILRYTACCFPQLNGQRMCFEAPLAFLSRRLVQLRVSYQSVPYSFKQAGATRTKSTSSSLGSVLRHCGDADHMETLLSFSTEALSFAKATQMNVEQLSPSKLDVVCGRHHFTIDYPYPVDFSQTKIQLFRSKGTMNVTASRRSYHLYEEKPLFFVNPDHKMSLPTLQVANEALGPFCSMQLSKEEQEKFDLPFQERAPMVNVKESIAILFQHTQSKFFTFVSQFPDRATGKKQLWASVLVHRRACDTQRCSPVLDVSYIVEATFSEEIRSRWFVMALEIDSFFGGHRQVFVDEEEWQVLNQVLKHFANRTLPTSKNPSRILKKHSLDKYYTRAVIYPLYLDQDAMSKMILEMGPASSQAASYTTTNANASSVSSSSSSSFTSSSLATAKTSSFESAKDQNKCSFCGNTSESLRKCTGCGSTWYCGKECQTRHWRQHKSVCKPTTHTTTASPSAPSSSSAKTVSASPTAEAKNSNSHSSIEGHNWCSFCGNTSEKLRKCTGCGSTWYCGKECQTRHWKQHKAVCKPPVIPIAMALPSKCASCGKDSSNLKRCACQFVAYCSKECQRNDWARHRTNCTASTHSK